MERQRAAAAIQREAARKQADAVAQWFASQAAAAPASDEPAPNCAPIPDPYASALLGAAANAQQLDPKLLRAVILQESGFRPCAVSRTGAQGLMQLMPATVEQFQVKDAFDPHENIQAGAKYLKQLLEKYKGDLTLALAAFNSGPSTVDAAKGVPNIKETRDYIDAILARLPAKPVAR
jgi:soluble lytic murein transglycosylase-like protein